MSATAAAILHWNAIPIFADICPKTYNLTAETIEPCISDRTKAIIVADIFGQSADMFEIRALAKKYSLRVISDTAQAPGAMYHGHYAGTLADIGGFSLNYHKHIHTGEGGILVTNDERMAKRLQLIRNHAEAVVGDMGEKNLVNMLGHNFRLGEIECAIGIEQLKKLNSLVESRTSLGERLSTNLRDLPGLSVPHIGSNRTHVFYVYPLQVDVQLLGVSRDRICDALSAEGVTISKRYQNIHLLPIYQKKIAYGSNGFPWTATFSRKGITYQKGICPVAERLNDTSYMGFGLCNFDFTPEDIDLIVASFRKVWANIEYLR
jgi:dTDP-4-amino-4,6-dideoxygalactose transaminase